MTDRYHVLTVVLEKPIRKDDAEPLITAISQMRGVLKVTGEVTDSGTYFAMESARQELGTKLWEVLYPKK